MSFRLGLGIQGNGGVGCKDFRLRHGRVGFCSSEVEDLRTSGRRTSTVSSGQREVEALLYFLRPPSAAWLFHSALGAGALWTTMMSPA